MAIDWFTFIAQIINFFILVWLLKRFLYRPILDAIDAREKKIEETLHSARTRKIEAEQQFDQYQTRKKVLDEQAASLLEQAKAEADNERERLIDLSRKEVDVLRMKKMKSLRQSIDQLKKDLYRKTKKQVFSITRKVLADLASTRLEQSLIEKYLAQLRNMEASKRVELIEALDPAGHPMVLRTAFELTPDEQTFMQTEIDGIFGQGIELRFETNDKLISGIELLSNGQKLAWSVSNYLESLEKSVESVLKLPLVSVVPKDAVSEQLKQHQ